MATVSPSPSAWAKPGAWALDSENYETLEKERANDFNIHERQQQQQEADFPSLSATASTKSKKKKPLKLSISEFHTGLSVTYGAAKAARALITLANGLTADELLILPTGPRERTDDELSSSGLGGGFRSYGGGRFSNGDDSSNTWWGSSRVSDESRRNGGLNRECGPSRADEIDDWGAGKKTAVAPAIERRERRGFFDSQSRADESDNWLVNKSFVPSAGRRIGGGGRFENHRERQGSFEAIRRDTLEGRGADSESWGKKREEGSGSGSGRPRLVLKPRTLPVSNAEHEQLQSGAGSMARSKGSNPFGDARPREEVLAEKGHDWKKIDEQLESAKVKEIGSGGTMSDDGMSSGKRSFGTANGGKLSDDRMERSWRKMDSVDVPSPSVEKVADEGVAGN